MIMNDVQKASLVDARSKLHKTKMSFVFATNQCLCWIPNSINDKCRFIFIIRLIWYRYIDSSKLYHTSRHFAKKCHFLVTFHFMPYSCHRDVSVGKNQAKHDCEHAIIDSREMEIRDRLNIQDMLSIYNIGKT